MRRPRTQGQVVPVKRMYLGLRNWDPKAQVAGKLCPGPKK